MRARLVLLTLMLVAAGAAAELYSWKDAAGKIHYSDQPPPDSAARKLTVPPPNTYSGGMPAEKEKPRVAPSEMPAPAAEKPKAAPAPDRSALCEQAKAELQKLEETPRRMSSAGGRPHPVDSEERAAAEARLQKAIADNCR